MTDSNTVDAPESRFWALAQAGIVAVAFSLLLAGTNAVNPLLPVYREVLRLEPFVLSLTFVFYVTVLVIALVVLARPSLTRHATGLLLAALAVALGADALLSLSTEWSVLVGRMVAGVAGGLATGAAAALVVAAIGARGRALSATGNLVGAVVGTAASQIVIELRGSAATHEVFLWHGIAVLVVLVAASIVLRVRRAPNRLALATVAGVPEKLRLRLSDARYLATGCVAWAGVSVAIVLGATVFAELDSPLVRAVGPALMLGSSAAGQLASPHLARVVPWMSGVVLLSVGALGIAAGAVVDSPPLSLAGFAALGIGIGISYRAGLVALSRGASPARQGALSSAYGAITYAVAAAVVLTVGAVGNVTGVVPAAIGALVVTAVFGLVLLPFAPRLRDTVDRV
ncbi:MFS family permease [Conyzicola lurida]|uniref:MFS family permease n=1 Tax=Conyzicola lurida TaxID=1172621 RepID=A0A841AJS7_9MICO|nr:MFS transporter [Conyzicola lurida]MBB5841961.1 MFS family permease [Conyzicola lurida]